MVEIETLPDGALITVRCSRATLDIVGQPAGLDFPRQANRFLASGPTRTIWISPDDWMISDDRSDSGRMLSVLERAFAGHDAAVVDVSGNRVRLRISGPGALALMNRACSLDLDPPHFATGHCAGTMVARTQAFVLQVADTPLYEIFVRRSFATYLIAWLETAARGLAPPIDERPSPESSATRHRPA